MCEVWDPEVNLISHDPSFLIFPLVAILAVALAIAAELGGEFPMHCRMCTLQKKIQLK
jgi:hypothetical protein